MTPNSLTLSLFNSNSCSLTWHSETKPSEVYVMLSNDTFFSNAVKCEVTQEKHTSFEYPNDNTIEYYVLKSNLLNLKAGEKYFYKIFQKGENSKTYTFTAPNPNKNSFNFITISDSQIASDDGVGTGEKFSKTISGITQNALNADFILHTGDVVEWSKYEAFWEDLINFNSDFFSKNPIAAISGNHETTYRNGSFETFKHFNYDIPNQNTEKGIYYSFDYSGVRFIMLNTNELYGDKLTQPQYDWLLSKLEKNPQKWTIVALHNPLYSIGKYGSNPDRNSVSVALRDQLVNVLAKFKVDLVLQGHDHAYSKTYPIGQSEKIDKNYQSETINGIKYALNPKGPVYIMNGPAGDERRAPYEINSEIYEFADTGKAYSWAEFEVTDTTLTVKIYSNESGTPVLWQSFGIKK